MDVSKGENDRDPDTQRWSASNTEMQASVRQCQPIERAQKEAVRMNQEG